MTVEHLIRRGSKLKNAKWEKTPVPIFWYYSYLPVGTEYKAFETQNFGWVVLRKSHDSRRFMKI